MKLSIQSVACAVLAAAFLLGEAKPSEAQVQSPVTSGATIARGRGTINDNGTVIHGTFVVKQGPLGIVQGYLLATAPSVGSVLRMDITSCVFVDGLLGLAGKVTTSVGFPPALAVGRTAFFLIDDVGTGGVPGPDLFSGLLGIGVSLGNLTAEQIYAIFGPPPQWFPLLSGDLRVLS